MTIKEVLELIEAKKKDLSALDGKTSPAGFENPASYALSVLNVLKLQIEYLEKKSQTQTTNLGNISTNTTNL